MEGSHIGMDEHACEYLIARVSRIERFIRLFGCVIGAMFAILLSPPETAVAQTSMEIQAVPSSWLVQEYVPSQLVLWYTGSSCNNGYLAFPSNATQADQNLLASMVLTAKATGQQIIVYYYVQNDLCLISSFAIPN